MSAILSQQRQQIGRPIALRGVFPFALLIQQREQTLLELGAPRVGAA